jgi:predicted kinase
MHIKNTKFHDVSDLVKNKFVNSRGNAELNILKYTKTAFSKQEFNDKRMLDCRGVVIDGDNQIAQLPFRKIFNHGEKFAPIIDGNSIVCGVHKLNGFMLSLSIHNNKLLWSTSGSLQNQHIEMGREFLCDEDFYIKGIERNFTYIFEICHPSDPHIVKEEFGAYLIGARLKDGGLFYMKNEEQLDLIAKLMDWKRPIWRYDKFENFVSEMSTNKTEGYIIKGQTWCENTTLQFEAPLLKLKTDWYRFCKILARQDESSVDLAGFIAKKNEEYLKVFEFVKNNKRKFFELPEYLRLTALNTMEIPSLPKNIYNGTLVLLRGLPGAGKSTFASEVIGIDSVEADDFFLDENSIYKFEHSKIGEAHANCKLRCEKLLIQGDKVVCVSNTFTTEKEMQPYFELAKKYNYYVSTVIVENRNENISIHNVPSETIDKMKNRFNIKL